MKILLQDTETGLYLGRGGWWSDNPDGALAFLSEVRAQDFAIYHHFPNAKVVVRAESGGSAFPPTTLSSAAKTKLNTEPIMKAKENTPQTSKLAPRKRSRSGPGKVSRLAQQIPVTFEDNTRRKPVTGKGPCNQDSSPAGHVTVVEAKIDVGLGNTLFIRGQGDGLSWFKGVPLNCVDATTWLWSTPQARDKVVFKLLLNDEIWARGEDVVAEAGRKIEIVPSF